MVSSIPTPTNTEDEQSMLFCMLCLCNYPLAATSKLHACDCVFCTSCLRQYVQLAVREGGGAPITCPAMACPRNGILLDSEITDFAPDQVQLYQQLRFERGVYHDPTKAWCPVLECQAVCTVKRSPEGRPTSVPCPACCTVFCSQCRGSWQVAHTCPEHQLLTSLPNPEGSFTLSSEPDAAVKQCPMCCVYIERNQGCAQMLCKSCKHTFCWHCLQNLDDDIFLRHYDKGPCRNKLGHSRASVVGILVGMSIIALVALPLLLLAFPCIMCCSCKPCRGSKKKKKKNELSHSDSTV